MAFLRNSWYATVWAESLPPGSLISRRIIGEPIVLFKNSDGSVGALADACSHRFAPLHKGRILSNNRLRCPYHGLEFDTSGACVRNPHGAGRIPPNAGVKSYLTAEKHTMVWIWMGDRPGDPDLIPDFGILKTANPAHVSRRQEMVMEANYLYIAENLLDLSHANVLHEGLLGNEKMFPAQIRIEQRGTTLTVTRFTPDVPPPGLYDLLFRRDGERVDIWADMRWDSPGCLVNDTGATVPGGPRSEGTGVYGTHFLTPITETSTLYQFAAVRQNPRSWGEPIDSEVRAAISDLRQQAFEEQDRAMIEGQQRNLSDPCLDTSNPAFLEVDAGPVRFRRILDELIRKEQGPTVAAGEHAA